MSDDRKTGTPKDSHYARLRRTHRDRTARDDKPFVKPRPRPGSETPPAPPDGLVRLYGLHTVRAAIDNPRRTVMRLAATRNALRRLGIEEAAAGDLPFPVELVEPREIDRLLGADAVHQGVMIEARPLGTRGLGELKDARLLLVLDQVTDPHNVGAIIRSAVAFGADAIITTARHSPAEGGVLAKAASGALEHIEHIAVRNLAEALTELAGIGFQTIGLDSEGPGELETAMREQRIALVLGAEGKGLRQKTRETVADLVRLDLPGAIRSLNVSNAASVSLYAARRHLR